MYARCYGKIANWGGFSSLRSLGGASPRSKSSVRAAPRRPAAPDRRREPARKTRPAASIDQPRALELVKAGKIGQHIEPEMRQERLAGSIGHRAARRLAPAAQPRPAGFQQHVERTLGRGDAANFLDLGARHRLMIGDDSEHFDRGAREFSRHHQFMGQQPGEIVGCA